jgi:hypothetical protein
LRWLLENKKSLGNGHYYERVASGMRVDDEPFNPTEFCEVYYDAYRELTSCIQFEGGPIPFTSVFEYFRIYSIEGSFDDFLYIIRVMEKVFFDFEEEKRAAKVKEDNAKFGKKNNNPVRRPK